VTQRGNNRQDVFFTGQDRQFYLAVLGEQCQRFGLRVVGYCLMANHVHLVASPQHEDSLAKAVGRTNLYYTRHINRLHGRSGHLWQDRFFSSPLDEQYFWNALMYAERNPVRARLVGKAWEWPWSSAAAHVAGEDPTGLLDIPAWSELAGPNADWRECLARDQDEQVVSRLRTWSHRGCPLGSDTFISKLEAKLGRRLRPARRGRPRNKRSPKNGNRPD
jgi:putative transposase